MILTGTNYNLTNDSNEIKRLKGGSIYNESSADHFNNLYKRKPIVSGGSFKSKSHIIKGGSIQNPSKQQIEEMVLRVNANDPRKVIKNKTYENIGRSISGRSTRGILKDNKQERKNNFNIINKNTKIAKAETQQLLP